MIDTIVLDLDGPLLEGRDRHFHCYSTILREHGFEPVDKDLYWQMKRERQDRRKLLALSEAVSLYDEFLVTWLERIETREYLLMDRLQNDVTNVLQSWKAAGVTLFLATMRNSPANLYWQLEHLRINDLFDAILPVGSALGGDGKAAKVKTVLQGRNPGGVIWIGDTEVDIAAAHELGVPVCALDCGLRTREYLASLAPDWIEHDLCAFAAKLNR